MDVSRFFSAAAAVAIKKDDKRGHRIGAVAIRKDGAIVSASNGGIQETAAEYLTVCADGKKRYPQAHAEVRLSRKLDAGSIVFICRVAGHGSYALAKPCRNCERVLRNKGVKKVYYTISNNEYGVILL